MWEGAAALFFILWVGAVRERAGVCCVHVKFSIKCLFLFINVLSEWFCP